MLDDPEKPAQDVQRRWDDVSIKKVQQQSDLALKRARQLLKLPVYPDDLYR